MLAFLLGSIDLSQLEPHAERIKAALQLAGISIEKAAVWMEIDRRQFERQLDGEGHLSYSRLSKLPVEFWRWYGVVLAEDVGLPPVVRRAVRLQLALLSARRRMARITVHSARKERQIAS